MKRSRRASTRPDGPPWLVPRKSGRNRRDSQRRSRHGQSIACNTFPTETPARPAHAHPDATPPRTSARHRDRQTTPDPAPRSGPGLLSPAHPRQMKSVPLSPALQISTQRRRSLIRVVAAPSGAGKAGARGTTMWTSPPRPPLGVDRAWPTGSWHTTPTAGWPRPEDFHAGGPAPRPCGVAALQKVRLPPPGRARQTTPVTPFRRGQPSPRILMPVCARTAVILGPPCRAEVGSAHPRATRRPDGRLAGRAQRRRG
ncbi:hypothetical protein SAMN05421783_116105 [Thiocapsa roseopersicina]|uniref:Uncharacterized protein n=1 Tax=Thiocapsa roseopersicina TaxID=1058 RepID=A0A1H2ZP13_THIRO|nr:hypothetical protein SAMN05421783_116105 [Thiocapsa roseopersicina]